MLQRRVLSVKKRITFTIISDITKVLNFRSSAEISELISYAKYSWQNACLFISIGVNHESVQLC